MRIEHKRYVEKAELYAFYRLFQAQGEISCGKGWMYPGLLRLGQSRPATKSLFTIFVTAIKYPLVAIYGALKCSQYRWVLLRFAPCSSSKGDISWQLQRS
jgi:hypothetical protein